MLNCQLSQTLLRAPKADHPLPLFFPAQFRRSPCPVDPAPRGGLFAGCFRVGWSRWLVERQQAPCGSLRAFCEVYLSRWVLMPLSEPPAGALFSFTDMQPCPHHGKWVTRLG